MCIPLCFNVQFISLLNKNAIENGHGIFVDQIDTIVETKLLKQHKLKPTLSCTVCAFK